MSIGKKLIAYVMSVVMVVGMIPMSAVAAEGEGGAGDAEYTVTAHIINNEGGAVTIDVNPDETTENSEQTREAEGQEEPAQNGSVSKNVSVGKSVTITAVPESGYAVEGWYSDASGAENHKLVTGNGISISDDNTTCTISNIQEDKTVYVKFAKHTYREPKSWIWTKTESGYSAAAIFICETCSKQVQSSPVTATKTFVKEATCTSAGQIEYIASVTFEGKVYSDKKTGETIPPKGHKLSKTPAKPATCTASGNKEYYTCGMCHAHFADNGGRTVIAQNSWIVNAKGHSIASRVDKKPTDKKEGCIVKGCGVCGYVEERLVIPKKKLTLNLGKSAKLVSNARGCTFTLANAKKDGSILRLMKRLERLRRRKIILLRLRSLFRLK